MGNTFTTAKPEPEPELLAVTPQPTIEPVQSQPQRPNLTIEIPESNHPPIQSYCDHNLDATPPTPQSTSPKSPMPTYCGLDITQLQPTQTTSKSQSTINCRSAFYALNLDAVPYWKNQCQVDVNQVKYVWIYSGVRNGWWFMAPNINTQVEALYQRWVEKDNIDSDNHICTGNNDFKYNFDKMCQINRLTQTNRTIQRLDINKVNELENNCQKQFNQVDFIWLYQTNSQFVPFLPSYQEELEAGYQDYLDNPEDPDSVHYNFKYSNGFDYQINYKKKTQLNRHTGIRRPISRAPKSEILGNPEYSLTSGFVSQRPVLTQSQTQPMVDLNTFSM